MKIPNHYNDNTYYGQYYGNTDTSQKILFNTFIY